MLIHLHHIRIDCPFHIFNISKVSLWFNTSLASMRLVCAKKRLRLPVIFFRPGAYMYITIWRPLQKPSNEPLRKGKNLLF